MAAFQSLQPSRPLHPTPISNSKLKLSPVHENRFDDLVDLTHLPFPKPLRPSKDLGTTSKSSLRQTSSSLIHDFDISLMASLLLLEKNLGELLLCSHISESHLLEIDLCLWSLGSASPMSSEHRRRKTVHFTGDDGDKEATTLTVHVTHSSYYYDRSPLFVDRSLRRRSSWVNEQEPRSEVQWWGPLIPGSSWDGFEEWPPFSIRLEKNVGIDCLKWGCVGFFGFCSITSCFSILYVDQISTFVSFYHSQSRLYTSPSAFVFSSLHSHMFFLLHTWYHCCSRASGYSNSFILRHHNFSHIVIVYRTLFKRRQRGSFDFGFVLIIRKYRDHVLSWIYLLSLFSVSPTTHVSQCLRIWRWWYEMRCKR